MSLFGSARRRRIAWLASGAFVIYAVLQGLYSFNTSHYPLLTPRTTAEILVFTAMSVVVFLLLMVLLVLLLRNIVKLFMDERSRALGSRLRTRLVIGAALIALAPAMFMFYFSFLLLNRSVDRWFSQPTAELRENSTRVVLELAHYAAANARLEAEAIAASGAVDKGMLTRRTRRSIRGESPCWRVALSRSMGRINKACWDISFRERTQSLRFCPGWTMGRRSRSRSRGPC